MIIISEKLLDNKAIDEYEQKGIRYFKDTKYATPYIKKGEAVGFILDYMAKRNIDLIGYLLYCKHNVTIKYEDEVYKLNSIDDWRKSYQSETDCLKQTKEVHPILTEYYRKVEEYKQLKNQEKAEEKYSIITDAFDGKLPNENEVDSFLRAYAYLYQVDVDYTDYMDKLLKYKQINWYLDNDIPYANEPSGISLDDELMFDEDMFNISYEESIEEVSFGDETYFEDYCYKNL